MVRLFGSMYVGCVDERESHVSFHSQSPFVKRFLVVVLSPGLLSGAPTTCR